MVELPNNVSYPLSYVQLPKTTLKDERDTDEYALEASEKYSSQPGYQFNCVPSSVAPE